MPSRNDLEALIADEIRRQGPMPFDRFIDLSLYHASLGYFATSADRAGTTGDFWTAPEISPLFAACVHQWLESTAKACAGRTFDVIEAGAGRGTLAAELLARAPTHWRFHLLERGTAPRDALKQRFAGDGRVTVHADTSTLPDSIPAGAVVANELLDNLPVRRIMNGNGLQEVRVGLERGRLRETLVPAHPALAEAVAVAHLDLDEGHTAEVSPQAVPLFQSLVGRLRTGGFLFFDYGGEAAEVAGANAPHGTLAAHRGHARTSDLLANVGGQDLTHHVNFTPLLEAARRDGFEARLEDQARFLLAHGLAERLTESVAAATDPMDVLRLTQRAKQLYHPEALGEAFRAFHGRRVPKSPGP